MFNARAMAGGGPVRLLTDILAAGASAHPDKTALVCERRRLTYGELDEMSGRLANALIAQGIRPGDRVLLYMMNGPEIVAGLFAVLKAGAVFAVIDYAATYTTLRSAAVDSGASALFTHGLQAETAERLLLDAPSLRFAVLAGPEAHPAPSGRLSFAALLRDYPPATTPIPRVEEDLAYLLYTSGSTGDSKGVMTPHRSSLASIESGLAYFKIDSRDILVSALPLSYSPGMNALLKPLRAGATLILEPSFAFPAATLKRMATEGATGFFGVPTILELFLRARPERYDLSRLRFVSSVGSPLDPGLIRRFRTALPRVEIRSFYGLAEASYSLALDPSLIDSHPTSVGKPFPGAQAWVVDDADAPLAPDEPGELVVRGNHVRSGYWNDPATTAFRFRPGPLPGELVYHTGDVFRTDADGLFYFLGRKDEMIKSGAKKIAPRELESALLAMPGVLEAAAIGVPDPLLGTVIKAFVVLDAKSGSAPTAEDILLHCRRVLEDFKVPRAIEIRDRLPRTSSGKVRKNELS